MLKEELLRYLSDLKEQWKSYEREIELAYRHWIVVNLRLELLRDSLHREPIRQRLLSLRKSTLEGEIKTKRNFQKFIIEELSACQLDLDSL